MASPKSAPVLTFAPGERVLIRDEEWLVRSSATTLTGSTAVEVTGLSELVRGKDAVFLTDIDEIEPLRPEDTKLVADDSPRYRRSRLYLESLLRKTPPTDDRIHLGHRAAIDTAPYQLVPAHKALSRIRPRLLIADGVGLGKTIEVGILLTELIRRGRGRRILVVALKSILEQFQSELWGRFAIPLVRLDSEGIRRVRTQIPANMNPFHHFDRVIISIDTLKRDEKYAAQLEQAQWDVVVIDECQNVALRGNSASKRRRLAERVSHTTDALILTSATPHDGSARSLASLVHLLDPTAIANPESFVFEEIEDLFVRRFKRDVADQAGSSFFERQTEIERVQATPDEEAALLAISKASFKTLDRGRAGGALFRTTLLKAFLSSPEACLETLAARKNTLVSTNERRKTPLAQEDIDADLEHLDELEQAVSKVTPKSSSKLARLFERLDALGYAKGQPGERVVIFSERIRTLKLLQAQLQKAYGLTKAQAPIFHGQLSDVDQQRLVKAFGTKDTGVAVFLASDAASEGINLHFFCHRMIHFDVPWSLITLEQRNGRIDRFGQEAEPDIRYIVLAPQDADLKGDLRVVERLIDKEKEAHKNLGDAALLMKAYDADKEADRVAKAVEREISPEEAVPDVETVFGDDDPLMALLNGGAAPPLPEKADPTADAVSFFEDDLGYAKEAFAELGRENEGFTPPELYEDPAGFLLKPPDDLKPRFRHLPKELRPDADSPELFLTVDRDKVKQSLADARKTQDKFPEWSLFWPLHPVAEWLDDRLLAHFGRHEAPVIDVADLPDAAVVTLLFQGIISNKRSQPVAVEWFGVGFDASAAHVGTSPLTDLISTAGLDAPLTNPTGTPDVDAFRDLIPPAVERALDYLQARRKARSDELVTPLKKELKRLRKWFAGVNPHKGQLDFEYSEAASPEKLDPKTQRAFEEAKKAKAAYERYVEEVLATVEQPSLRLVAVLARRAPAL